MEIKRTKQGVELIYFGYELDLREIYREELAYNVWEQREVFL